MKKIFILALIPIALLMSSCGTVRASSFRQTDTEYQTPRANATQTPVPTATIEYKATAFAAETQAAIAQATADQARRIMVQATNDQAQREHEAQIQNSNATQQAESNHAMLLSWTATAAQTAIPLTATAQRENLTAIAEYNEVTIAMITATAALPTQIVAEADAQTIAKFAPLRMGAQIFAMFAIGVFLLFSAWFMRWYWMRQDAREWLKSPAGVAGLDGFVPVPDVEPEIIRPETIVTVRQDFGGGNMRMDKYTVPCSKEQLLQVAENILTKGWTLGINQWESAETLFTRNTFGKLRSWLQGNKFAISTGGGTLALTPEGHTFLEEFLNKALLPTEYQFTEAMQ